MNPRKQPDLEWYFDTANTSPENRLQVLDLVMRAPESALRLFRIGIEEEDRIVWWWQMLTLVAVKKDLPPPPSPETEPAVAVEAADPPVASPS
jgi:hypothetical protein